MNTGEFSTEFDTLTNSHDKRERFGISSEASVVFDEYEKSVFLTKAQEEIVISLYTGNTPEGKSFEGSEKLRRSVDNLIRTITLTPDTEYDPESLIGKNSTVFTVPADVWFITYETARLDSTDPCISSAEATVIPMTQDDFALVQGNPFRGPASKRIIRLDLGEDKKELVSKYPVLSYKIRYLARPTPIILVPLYWGVTIRGLSAVTECTLNTVLHEMILDRAVSLALMSRAQQIQSNNN